VEIEETRLRKLTQCLIKTHTAMERAVRQIDDGNKTTAGKLLGEQIEYNQNRLDETAEELPTLRDILDDLYEQPGRFEKVENDLVE